MSPETYVNVMSQYRPEYQVGQIAANGAVKYDAINRAPRPAEMESALAAARRAGLWRFDQRRLHQLLRWS